MMFSNQPIELQLPKVLLCFSLILVTILAFGFAISGMTREADREGQTLKGLDNTWHSNFSSNQQDLTSLTYFLLNEAWEEAQVLFCDNIVA